MKNSIVLSFSRLSCINWRTTFYVGDRYKTQPSWNSSIARARHDGHTASYRSMDSFREHSRVKRQSLANCTTNCCPPWNHVSSQEDLLLALIVSERNRPLDYSGWIRAWYVCRISMSRRNENRIEQGNARQGTKGSSKRCPAWAIVKRLEENERYWKIKPLSG